VSEFQGREYNYETWSRSGLEFEAFKSLAHAGEPAIDFTLPSLDGETITLSELQRKPVVIEFGAIT
jgi:hypothetical protein